MRPDLTHSESGHPGCGPGPGGRAPVRWAAALGLALALAPAGRAQALDPFAPHQRWAESATPASAWLPRSVAFAAGGELVLGAGSVGAPRALLLSSPDLSGQALVGTLALDGALGTVEVAAGDPPGLLFTLSQHALTGPGDRTTRVTRLSTDPGPWPGELAAEWSVEVGSAGNGAARLALAGDGSLLVAAVGAANAVEVILLDPLDAGPRGTVLATGGALRGLALSDDGGRLALLAGPELWVLDGAGAVVHRETLPVSTNALALSGDGATVVVGDGAGVRVLADGGPAGYLELVRLAGAPGEVAVCAALDRAGARMSLGFWDQLGGQRARFEVRSRTGAVLHSLAQTPGPAGLQNYPQAVAITPDGRRAAYDAWGVGDPQPELVLVDVDSAALVLAVDLAGSARALALYDDGTRLAGGVKHVHANQFGATGELVLHDTGERELQLTARPAPAGALELSSLRAGAQRALFVLGTPLARPVTFRGAGWLWIDRGGPLRVKGTAPDASGRADVTLDLQTLGPVLGAGFGVQAAWRVGGATEFGMLVVPVVL